jgi:hypothetical protein
MKRSYYSNSISGFLTDPTDLIHGKLSNHHSHALEESQKRAWIKQIEILRATLQGFEEGHLYFEFSIPRMGKRVDNILIIKDLVFVLEFKIGETLYPSYGLEQVEDYCLDLKNFHEGSHNATLIPILICTRAEAVDNSYEVLDNLYSPLKANAANLKEILNQSLEVSRHKDINPKDWEDSIYKPTPTIIQAAQALYKGHHVREISRHDSGVINLSRTTECINRIIEQSKAEKKKSICFLTGVPGAGKTLAGLNIANERMKADENEHAVFLSGNGPLVDVLREALARDSVQFEKEKGNTSTKKKEKDRAVKFIQNIHHFRDDNFNPNKKVDEIDKAPVEKVVVFDEAQRAWSKEQVSQFMKRKKGVEDFDMSEPHFLISVMDRHEDWCTIICLIGGGQEINTGEAGVSEWLDALKNNYSEWQVHYSNLITLDDNYLSNDSLIEWLKKNAIEETALHLSVSVRSFRSEKVKTLFSEILPHFPICVTRDLATAKRWLREKARGTERIGIVASSGGRRLRPLGIDVKNELYAPDWFLNGSYDVRSSNYMEDVATEFDIQGLEIDWVCMAWDINFYYKNDKWNYQNFTGTSWKQIQSESVRSYLQNAYRVLLTRARQGLIIYLPMGDDLDHTRPKALYDNTFNYLISCGLKEV